jgi:DinB superfamily
MKSNQEKILRDHLLYLLKGGGAHTKFEDVTADFPTNLRGKKVTYLPHTAWMLLEHMRIAQWDILEFSRDAEHVSPEFPDGYWPPAGEQTDQTGWNKSLEAFLRDLKEMEELVMNRSTDLLRPIPHGAGQTIMREALLVADHNAYHLGALMTMKKAAGE